MKINWALGLILSMIAFVGFILYFVITMTTEEKYIHQLVTPDYYKKELEYPSELAAEANAQKLGVFSAKRTQDGWQIVFPESVDLSSISGVVKLYRPSNQKLDFELPISITDSVMVIPDTRLVDGRWNIEIRWEQNGIRYLHKSSIWY